MFRTEFFQPLELGGAGFVSPYFRYYRIPLALWQEGDEIAKYKYTKVSVGGDIGVGSKYGELRLGPVYNNYDATRTIGSTVLPQSYTYDYGLRLNLFFDQLDNYFFPTTGEYLDLYAYRSMGGSEEIKDYGLYGFSFRDAISVGLGVIQFTVKAQTATNHDRAVADVNWLGGFLNLSSYRYQELLGEQIGYGSAQYYHRLGPSGTYWGIAAEVGRVFDYFDKTVADRWHYSGTGYLAYDSALGPMYLAAAYGDNHVWTGYFMLGKQF